MVEVVLDATVFPFLLGIVLRQCRAKQIIINVFKILAAQDHIIFDALFVHILRNKFSVVMGNTTLANAYAYSLFHGFSFQIRDGL